MKKDLLEKRGVTLNSLLEEQRSLNMRLLLAVQLQDWDAQEALRRELGTLVRFTACVLKQAVLK